MKDILPELNNKDYIEALYDDYELRFCKEEEYAELVVFLKNYWRKDHIFVLSKEILDFQHYDSINHRYNFMIAKHKKSGEIHSILGFVPTNHYDNNIENIMVWPCIWKSRDDINRKGLGVSLYYQLKNVLPIETISILGISEIALSIYKHWNFKTGKIEQYFMPNRNMCGTLSSGFEYVEPQDYQSQDIYLLKEMNQQDYEKLSSDDMVFASVGRYKSKLYYENRFFKHPAYKYHFWEISQNGNIKAIV